jgi:hypothetical protein
MIYTELPPGCTLFELPSLAARKGSARLRAVEEVLGAEGARRAARAAGPYLLSDELCRKLRLEGLEIEEELSALSPSRWEPGLPASPPEAELVGILLEPNQRKRLLRFAPALGSPQAALSVAERFFYERPLKLIVRYTAPRFKPQ